MKKLNWLLLASVGLALSACDSKNSATSDTPGTSGEPGAPQDYLIYDEDFEAKAGRVLVHTLDGNMKGGTMEVEMHGQTMSGTMDTSELEVTRIETLGAGKQRIMTISNAGKEVTKMAGQEMPDAFEPSPLLKVPVLLTLGEDGKWSATLEDGSTPSPQQQEEMTSIADEENDNTDKQVYGTERREIGETWTAKAEDLKFMGETEMQEGEMHITLDKVEEYQGQQCAFMSGDLDLSGEPDDMEEGLEGTMRVQGDFKVIRSLDQQVDLLLEIDGRVEFTMTVPGGKVEGKMPLKFRETTKVE